MTQTLTIHLEKPIASVQIMDDSAGRGGVGSAANAEQILTQDSEAQKTAFSQAFQALNAVVAKLNEFYDKVFVEHKEEIAKLSVEIASLQWHWLGYAFIPKRQLPESFVP